MIFVEVFQVAGMMYAVMGGRVENIFYRAGQPVHGLGMDPELIDKTDLLHQYYNDGMEADEWHP